MNRYFSAKADKDYQEFRRTNKQNNENDLLIISCKGHYED
jgi:carbonic anhydrase